MEAVKAWEAPEDPRELCSVGTEGAGPLWVAEEGETQRDQCQMCPSVHIYGTPGGGDS